MKRILIPFILILIAMNVLSQSPKTFHDFKVTDLDGQEFDFSQFSGKKVLVVNTASRCGFTKQYEDLQKLYMEYGDEDFSIVGFPANNFLQQEPGSDEKIRNFCTVKFGVTFPMMSKISVKGKDMHPVYQWLTRKDQNGKMDSSVKWNFQKYLINEDGSLEGMLAPKVEPYDPQITDWIIGD
jgi:glutathione peroxidase